MNRNNTGLLILILALLLPVCAMGTANTTADSSPENAVLCYLNALKAGDMETAAHFSSAALPIDQWKMEKPMTALVYALMDDVFVTQVTYVDENSARVLMHISHADFDVLEKADWFSQITDVNFISWQDIDTEPDPDNGQPEGGFAYIFRMAKNSCMTEETIEYFVRKENGEWLVDLDETARVWMKNDKSGAAPEVFAASFGLIDHDYAQERYYAYEEYAASLDGEEIETDWNVWLTLTAPTGTDVMALDRLRGYSLTGADEMILNAPDYYFTDGSCEWYSRRWMEEETLHAALEIKFPGEVSAETVQNALSGAALVCQAESWPLSIRCYHSIVSVDLTSIQYAGNRLEDCEITFEYARPKEALTQKQSDRLDEKGATFAEFLHATSGEYCSLDSVYDLWPGVPPEVLNAPYLEAGYTVYYLEGSLGRQDTSYGLHDLTFQALNAPDGVYVRRAGECGMCDAIDENDFWPGCGGNVQDVCVLVRDDAGDAQQLLRELQIEASCSIEWLTCLEDSHNSTYRIGPRFTIKTDTSGVVITGDNELALKTDGLLKKAEPLVWTATQFESLFRVDTAVAEDMAARPENWTHYRLTLTASAKTPMPFEISGIEWEYLDDYQRYSGETVNDFSTLLFVSSAPLGGKEAVADGSPIVLDVLVRAHDGPERLCFLTPDLLVNCRYETKYGSIVDETMTVNLSAWRTDNHSTKENDPEAAAAARVFLKAWAEGDAQTLYALAWPEFVAYHGDVLNALQSALSGMWKPRISEENLDSLVKKGKTSVYSLPDGTKQKMMRIYAQLPSIYGDAFDATYIMLNLYETKDGWKADLTQLYERMNWDGQDEETEEIQRGLFFLVDGYLATCSAKALNYDAGENETPSMYRTADADVRQAEETRLVAWEIGDAEKVLLDGEGMTFRVPCALYTCDTRGFLLPVIHASVSVEMTKNEGFRITGIGQ